MLRALKNQADIYLQSYMWLCWDNGYQGAGAEQSGLFDRATGNVVNDGQTMIDAMKKAVFTTDASYTLQSVYDGAPE